MVPFVKSSHDHPKDRTEGLARALGHGKKKKKKNQLNISSLWSQIVETENLQYLYDVETQSRKLKQKWVQNL